jgi:NAD(P)-dependent dehydrogenase (short-subunit alcohol dehydrogenase family)
MTAPSAIVTGAAAGIGRATVDLLVRDGWHVVGIDRADHPISGELLVGDAGDESVLLRAVEACDGNVEASARPASRLPARGTAANTGTRC